MDRSSTLEEAIIACAEEIDTGLDSTGEVEGVKGLETGLVQLSRPILNSLRKSDGLLGLA
jgi:hypothetical protein